MNGMKNLLYVAFAIFLVAIVAAVLIVVIPNRNSDKMDEYEKINRNGNTVVEIPEYVMDDEFRKESISEF